MGSNVRVTQRSADNKHKFSFSFDNNGDAFVSTIFVELDEKPYTQITDVPRSMFYIEVSKFMDTANAA